MYARGRVFDRDYASLIPAIAFFALRQGEEAVAFKQFGESFLCPLPEAWEIVYQPLKETND